MQHDDILNILMYFSSTNNFADNGIISKSHTCAHANVFNNYYSIAIVIRIFPGCLDYVANAEISVPENSGGSNEMCWTYTTAADKVSQNLSKPQRTFNIDNETSDCN